MMIFLFLLGALFACAAPPTIDPNTFGDRDPIPFAYPNNGTLCCQPFPETLTRAELAQSIANLPIPAENRDILVACAGEKFPSFLSARDEVVNRLAQKYIGMCASHLAHLDATEELPSIQQIRQRDALAETVRRELRQSELDFIDALGDCLEDFFISDQVASSTAWDKYRLGSLVLESLSLKAQRRNTAVAYQPRGDTLELRDMVNQLHLEDTIRSQVEPELLAYERSLASLKTAQCKARWGAGLRIQLLGHSANPNSEINIITTPGRIGVQIRTVTLASADRIARMLPEKQRPLFEQDVYLHIFPELALDVDGKALEIDFLSALNNAELSKPDAQRIENLQQSWQLEFDAWRRNAEASLLEWWDQRAFGFGHYRLSIIEPMRDELLGKRAQIHSKWRMILADHLPNPRTP